MTLNTRWGNEPRGQGPWSRYSLHFAGRDPQGFAIYECRLAETGMNYAELWHAGNEAWHADHGIAGHITDATGTTVFIFD